MATNFQHHEYRQFIHAFRDTPLENSLSANLDLGYWPQSLSLQSVCSQIYLFIMIQCHRHMVQQTNHHLRKAIKSMDKCVTSTTVHGQDKFSMRSAILLLNAVFLASALDTQVMILTITTIFFLFSMLCKVMQFWSWYIVEITKM